LKRISLKENHLDRNESTIERLFQKYINNECSPIEIEILLQYFSNAENEYFLKTLLEKESLSNDELIEDPDHSYLLSQTFDKIKSDIATNKKQQPPIVTPFYKKRWFSAAAAVVMFFLLGATVLFYVLRPQKEKLIAGAEKVQPVKDIQPGKNSAVLTLSNGTQILLDSAANGTLAQQGNMKVLKINGRISYTTGAANKNEKPVYNTIATTRGNEYQLILADGTKAWLNASSSIHFPAAFTGKERRVEITGEVYFEVAHDRSKPFKVEFSNTAGRKGEVEVLGTHFDVNAYPDENAIKTTLLEGSVKVRQSDKIQMLSPGQEAIISSDKITIKRDVDVAQVIAWKDGYFLFNNTDIQTIMRQVARWYDVEVKYQGKITEDGFSGKISREVPLSKFLKVLELNDVHVTTEGRTVIIGS
jgi:hypothetical protein